MLYERALHAATALPLDGAHAAASCMSCHGTNRPGLPAIRAEAGAGSAEVVFRLSERTCAECHADPHRADSAGKAPVDCAACHTTRAFRESTVNVADHARFKFALDGAHRAVACAACHTGLTKRPGATPSSGPTLLHEAQPKTVPLRAVKGTSCAACHETPHDVQFETRMDGGRCDACHRTESFDTTPAFDHGRDSQYPLDGAHAGVSCDRCHRSETVGGVKRTRYRPLPHRCEDCHVAKPTRGGS
ncbi:MAG: hypothetical protein SFU57_05765 [Gemmatimonadales bacterium]|nr:hypothetical protein [Gemmatimonadales bacterium]